MGSIPEKDGGIIVKAARLAIESMMSKEDTAENKLRMMLSSIVFNAKEGVFVSLYHHHTNELRGCIGFPEHSKEIRYKIVNAARAAAFEDKRFVPISKNELDETIVEVNLLSESKQLPETAKGRKDAIKIGRDGLIVEYGIRRGLLLPSVATENGMNKEEFLEAVCKKAGLNKNYWKQKNVHIRKFETQIFKEESPNGKVAEVT
jgi:hypothetical protein